MLRSWNVYLMGTDAPTVVTGRTVELGREWATFLDADSDVVLRIRREDVHHIELRESKAHTPRPRQEPTG